MDPSQYVVRRANVDDLEGLRMLWQRASLQVLEVEKHLTEFQLISSLQGDLVGAAALRIDGRSGLLHNEAFAQPEHIDEFRSLLWQRFSILARNHGLVRLWTREDAPFWHQAGFAEPDAETLKKLPASFGDPHDRWRTVQIRDETTAALSLEQEFELFQQASRVSTEEVLAQANRFRTAAYTVALIIFAVAAAFGGYLMFRSARDLRHSTPAPPPVPAQQP